MMFIQDFVYLIMVLVMGEEEIYGIDCKDNCKDDCCVIDRGNIFLFKGDGNVCLCKDKWVDVVLIREVYQYSQYKIYNQYDDCLGRFIDIEIILVDFV